MNELLRFGFAFPAGSRIASYVPGTGEIDPRIAVRHFCDRGAEGSGGSDAAPWVVLVPFIGFDAAGYLLGHGGGHFIVTEQAIHQVTAQGLRLIESLSDAGRIAAQMMERRRELIALKE